MKLVLITSDNEENIDQVLVLVDDDYDKAKLLKEAENVLDGECSIESEADVEPIGLGRFDTHRMYVG